MTFKTNQEQIILLICEKLYSLTDLWALMNTSSKLYRVCSTSNAKLRPKFEPVDGRHLFPPHPYLLLSAVAPFVSSWAAKSRERMESLRHTMIWEGSEGLLRAAVEISYLTLRDMRIVHSLRTKVIKPLHMSLNTTPTEKCRHNRLTHSALASSKG